MSDGSTIFLGYFELLIFFFKLTKNEHVGRER